MSKLVALLISLLLFSSAVSAGNMCCAHTANNESNIEQMQSLPCHDDIDQQELDTNDNCCESCVHSSGIVGSPLENISFLKPGTSEYQARSLTLSFNAIYYPPKTLS